MKNEQINLISPKKYNSPKFDVVKKNGESVGLYEWENLHGETELFFKQKDAKPLYEFFKEQKK